MSVKRLLSILPQRSPRLSPDDQLDNLSSRQKKMNEMEKPIFTCSQSASMFNLPQVMFVENAFLLLASSWLFTMVSWDTVGIPAAVFCSFLIGKTTLGDIITSKQTLEINASMFVNAQFILELHGSRFE